MALSIETVSSIPVAAVWRSWLRALPGLRDAPRRRSTRKSRNDIISETMTKKWKIHNTFSKITIRKVHVSKLTHDENWRKDVLIKLTWNTMLNEAFSRLLFRTFWAIVMRRLFLCPVSTCRARRYVTIIVNKRRERMFSRCHYFFTPNFISPRSGSARGA